MVAQRRSAARVTPAEVLLFVPNLIGYARVLLLLASFFYMPSSPVTAMVMYFWSAFLDAFDGMAARAFNQSSTYGGLLDMLTDRIGTMALIMSIATLSSYVEYTWLFQMVVCLDIVAHWLHLHSQLLPGLHASEAGGPTHHKTIDLNANPILHFYYQKGPLFIFCAANEVFFITLYLLHFYPEGAQYHDLLWWSCVLCSPVMFIKQLFSVVHLSSAAYNVAVYDSIERSKRDAEIKQ